MTSPIQPTQAEKSAADRAQTFLDWTKVNSTALSIGAAVIVVAAIGFWFYGRNQQIKETNAQRALLNAKQSLTSNNLQLAQTDLKAVYDRYGSTEAGVEAAMLLAQLSYDAGKPQDGISMLEKAAGSGAASRVEPTIRSLQGDGYAQMGKLGEAAKQYQAAAAATPFALEKAYFQAKAARAFQAAGDTAQARQLWTALAEDPTSSAVSEARVRLGELTAAPAKP
jgi:predicted negative regulator of RcsB-dependent stress response